MIEDWRHAGFGLYVHWPFCASKCPYCDFNSHVVQAIDQQRWADALLRELARVGGETPGRVLNSIYFGGGTPSLMAPETVGAIIEAARTHWTPANDIEITLEANPSSVEIGRFRAYADAGVNRVSLGVQALNDEDLRRLGRIHSAAEARAAFDVAKSCFGRVSFDLIYARQYQSMADWQAELTEALTMAVDHLSLYQLTIEPETIFAKRDKLGQLRGLPSEDLSADMYLFTNDFLTSQQMPPYEVSNYSVQDAESRHNLIYWRQGDWAAIGPGAHGRLTLNGQRNETEAARAPQAWLERVQSGRSGDVRVETQSDADRALEYLLMSMRLHEGMDLTRYAAMGGQLKSAVLDELTGLGLVAASDNRIVATEKGLPLLNAILRELAD